MILESVNLNIRINHIIFSALAANIQVSSPSFFYLSHRGFRDRGLRNPSKIFRSGCNGVDFGKLNFHMGFSTEIVFVNYLT